MARKNFSDKVRHDRVEFAGYRCEGILPNGQRCNADLKFRRWECDHDIPDRMGGRPVFENARALCKACHTAKYPLDRKGIDKCRRTEAKHSGAHVTKYPPIQSPGFKPSARTVRNRNNPKPPVERKRQIYADAF